MEENKKEFVERLGSLIKRNTRAGKAIDRFEYTVENGEEYVIIHYWCGYKRINVTADSCLAIMHDVYKALV